MKNALKKTLCGIGSCAVVAGGLLYFRAHTEPSPLPVSEPPAAQSAVSEPESNSLTDPAKEDVETLIQDGENMSSSEVEELLEKIAAQEENAAGSEASAAASSSRPEGASSADTSTAAVSSSVVSQSQSTSAAASQPQQDKCDAQIEALGLEPRDVTDIVLTHLDYDHAGGLADFPWARVHVHDREYRAAMHPGRTGRVRYRREQYAHGPNWQLSQAGHGGDRWFGFAGVHELAGLPGLAMVPLYGHTTGHVGIAVNVDGGWLLHAGDAYVSALQLNRYLPGLLLGGAAFGDPDPLLAARRVRTAARLAALVQQHGDEVTVFCAHDAHAYGELARHNPTPSPESKEA